MPERPVFVLLTCEHADRAIPQAFSSLFKNVNCALHRWYDPGARSFSLALSARYGWPCICGKWSRLLVDLNRSETHPALFSSYTKSLEPKQRESILQKVYRPFREQVEHLIVEAIKKKSCVVHLSCHSFTSRFNGKTRPMDVGVLYDPSRRNERELAHCLCQALKERGFSVRKNAPYKGVSDGHTTALRKKFSEHVYLGIEIEVNQRICSHRFLKLQEFLESFSLLGN